jgi:hypothetical protein
MVLPFTPAGRWFGFEAPPLGMLGAVVFLVVLYLVSAELLKRVAVAPSAAMLAPRLERDRHVAETNWNLPGAAGLTGRMASLLKQKMASVRASSRRQLTTQKLDAAPAFRREYRKALPRTASWCLRRREQEMYVSHRSAFAKPATPPGRHGPKSR